jgi:hypothetical protein
MRKKHSKLPMSSLGLVHPTGLALFDINHLENKLKGKTAQG